MIVVSFQSSKLSTTTKPIKDLNEVTIRNTDSSQPFFRRRLRLFYQKVLALDYFILVVLRQCTLPERYSPKYSKSVASATIRVSYRGRLALGSPPHPEFWELNKMNDDIMIYSTLAKVEFYQ